MCLRGTRWLLPSRSPVPTTMMIVAVMVAIAVIASLMATSISNVIRGPEKNVKLSRNRGNQWCHGSRQPEHAPYQSARFERTSRRPPGPVGW